MPGIADIHPHQPEHHLQGLLSIFHEMQHMLAICSGMDEVTLQPVAGAQGEFTAVRCVRAYFRNRGETQELVIVPVLLMELMQVLQWRAMILLKSQV